MRRSSAEAIAVADPGEPAAGAAPLDRAVVLRVAGRCAFFVLALLALQLVGPALHMRWWNRITATLAVAAVLCELFPARRHTVAATVGVLVLAQWRPSYAPYAVLFLGALYLLRTRTTAFVACLFAGTLILPKELFRVFYHQSLLHDWVADYLLAHTLLVSLLWLRERVRVPHLVANPSFAEWLTLFVFPTHPMNPLNIGPAELWAERVVDLRGIATSVALVAVKGAALTALVRHGPPLLGTQSAASLAAASWTGLWGVVLATYVATALTLSGTGDVVIAIARVLGWKLEHPFRWALLAWNPVELWRRWAIYNRKLLLKLVYFPLGGNRRHQYLNVLATFVASGVVLHTGWVGSKYWAVGVGGWRDQIVYFVLQGLAVCACLVVWRWRRKDPASDRGLRLSLGRVATTVLTQALSAWVHVLVLASGLTWTERWRIMARCLGL